MYLLSISGTGGHLQHKLYYRTLSRASMDTLDRMQARCTASPHLSCLLTRSLGRMCGNKKPQNTGGQT